MKEITMSLNYFDPNRRVWHRIENPTREEIDAALAAAAEARPCGRCNALIEFFVVNGHPIPLTLHEPDCPDAAA
jgi:hypothetical protein